MLGLQPCGPLYFITIEASELHIETLFSAEGDVTLILRTSSGDGTADGNGDMESGVRDWGDSSVEGERGSRLWVESVLLWPLVRCDMRRKKLQEALKINFQTNKLHLRLSPFAAS